MNIYYQMNNEDKIEEIKINKENYIISEIIINKEDIGHEMRIIYSYEEFLRYNGKKIDPETDYNYLNEK